MARRLGLVASSRHTTLDAVERRCRARGGGADTRLAAPDRRLGRSFRARAGGWCRRLTSAAAAAAARGLELGFHNHDAEVRPRDGGASFLDELLAGDALFLELDLGWAWYAGVDPLALLGRARGRCPLVHVKDFYRRSRARSLPSATARSATSASPRPPVAAGAEWLLVEQDETEGPALEAARRSLDGADRDGRRGGGMNSPTVGVVGCGVISRHYAENAKALDSFELVACADLDESQARALAEEHDLRVASVDELIGDPSIDVVLNLTPPGRPRGRDPSLPRRRQARLHREAAGHGDRRRRRARRRGGRLGLRIGCAPDTFLGSAYQAGRALLDEGAIGEPLSVSAAVLVGAQETWHPNPDIFFADGAGPLLDMGPYYLTAIVSLLGPVARVAGFASTRTRERSDRDRPSRGRAVRRGDAHACDRGDGARERRHRQPRRELRDERPVRLRPRDPRHRGRDLVPRPERLRRSRAHAPRTRGLAGNPLRRARRS